MTARVPRGVVALSLIAVVVVTAQLVRLSVYMADPTDARWSVIPWNAFAASHSCLSGYWAAAREVDTAPNVWDDSLSSMPGPTPDAPRVPKKIGRFLMDGYEYTPTFLLLPRALLHLTPEFLAFRALWFCLNLAVVLAAVFATSRRLAPAVGPSMLWLAPLILAPLSILVTFQFGNVQLACIAGALLGMLCLDRAAGSRHSTILYATGGLLLAYMTVSKLYPGMLVLYLLLRRDWRAVAWTSAWGVGLVLIGLADIGIAAHTAFLDHLPRLLSGESFPPLRNPRGISANMSVPGLTLKLGLFGVPHMSFGAMRVVGWIYTAILVGVVVRLARRPAAPLVEPIVWIVILLLATLRSPVLPVYGIFPQVWLLVILLAARWAEPGVRVGLIAMFGLLYGIGPNQTLWPPQVQALYSTVVQTAGAIVLAVAALRLAPVTVTASAASAASRVRN
jgi:alpha-1,2-mannosyltransferase